MIPKSHNRRCVYNVYQSNSYIPSCMHSDYSSFGAKSKAVVCVLSYVIMSIDCILTLYNASSHVLNIYFTEILITLNNYDDKMV